MNLPIRPNPGQSLIILATQIDPVDVLNKQGNLACHTDTSGLYSTIRAESELGMPIMLVTVISWGYDNDYTVYHAHVIAYMPLGNALSTVVRHGDKVFRETAERIVPEFLREGLHYRE